ncbi:MAG: winged helix-turn-helix domain-containing protein [Acidobacteriota bacterium]
MHLENSLARLAAALGSPSRSRMVASLMRGTARNASDLALDAGVMPQTASKHLAELVAVGILRVRSDGKFRRYDIAGPDIAHLIESMMVLAPGADAPSTAQRLRRARTCYDHIAGRLGVTITESLVSQGHLKDTADRFELTASGSEFLDRLGVPAEWLLPSGRPLTRRCLDWSERVPHVGGSVGAALARLCLARLWIRRYPDDRALEVTPKGREQLGKWFPI